MSKYRLRLNEDCYGNKLYKAQVKWLFFWINIHGIEGTKFEANNHIEDHKRKKSQKITYIQL
jgi:hypothetical protein